MHRAIPASIVIVAIALLAPAAMGARQRQGAAAETPRAQTTPPAPAQPAAAKPRSAMTPLDIQVVITRSQDGKPISRLPYALAVTANAVAESQLNMGSDVPVPSTTFTPAVPGPKDAEAKTPPAPPRPITSFSYRSVGTIISCRASSGDDGAYEVTISVDDTSVFTPPGSSGAAGPAAAAPVFRNFKARNTQLLLRDGQTRRFTAAADRVSGETVEVEVTLRVVK